MIEKSSAIALGFFDGVHIAHQKIIKSAVHYAKLNNLAPVVLTFDASPLELLAPYEVRYLTTKSDKEALISSLGAQAKFLPVNYELLSMEPEDFIEKILVGKFGIKHAVCGYNYRFGKDGRGDTKLLEKEGKRLGFTVETFPCEILDGESVSSSRIRKLLAEGNIHLANRLLGRYFFVRGTVSEGKKLGRKLGFPTANVFFDEKAVQLKKGVYKTFVTINEKCYEAITNVGTNPTLGGEAARSETYIPSFEGDLYGKEIKIDFAYFIRSEKKFGSIEELKEQIKNDLIKL